MNIYLALILLLIVVGSMIMLISPIANIILGQRRTRRVSESPVFYSETDRMLIPAVIVDNPPGEVTRDRRDRSSCQQAIPAVLGKHSCFNLTTIVGQVGWFVRATEGLLRTFTTRGSPQRRLVHAFIAFIIGIQGFHSLTADAAVNLIPNPSVESAKSAGTLPLSWNAVKSGTNTTTLTYKKNGGHNGSKSLYLNTSKLTSGHAKWYFTPVTVKPNTKYTYSGFYKSNVATKIYIANTNTSNAISNAYLTSPGASATAWKQVKVSFTTPANIKKITIYHLNNKVGWLQTDDFSLVEGNGPPPPSGNLVPNPSVETASGGQPMGWSTSVWGTNNSTFSYLNTGHTGSHSLRTEITAYTNGAATWLHTPKPVSGGRQYLYSDWYRSNVNTEVNADITLSNGTTQTYYLGSALASASWRQMKAVIDVPANAVSITVYHMIYSKGWLITDDFSLVSYTPAPFDRGLVSITFDDGWTSQYTNAFEKLFKTKYGLALKATFYIISSALTDQPDYMTAGQIITLHHSGMEIGSHSVTHPDTTKLAQAALKTEMSQSQQVLQNTIGVPVTDFAYPEGTYNANTIAVGKPYYQSQRNSDNGFNTKDQLDLTRLKIQAVNNGTTPAQVKAWVDRANKQKTWLILCYHDIDPARKPLPNDLYTTLPADLDAELQYMKDSGIGVVTMDQAIKEILPQL